MFKFKQYQWNEPQLKRKASKYDKLILVFGAIVLVDLYLLPSEWKMINIIPLIVALIMAVLSWRIQSQDKKLKKP